MIMITQTCKKCNVILTNFEVNYGHECIIIDKFEGENWYQSIKKENENSCT